MGSLPPPTSGIFLETSFRRSLASCEAVVAGDSQGREELKSWRTSPLFHHYVETLQDQLKELRATAGSRIDAELLDRYGQHVAAIASQLGKPEFGAAARPLPQPPAQQNGSARSPGLPVPPPPLRVPTLPPAATAAANGPTNGFISSTGKVSDAAQPSTANGPAAAAAQPPQPMASLAAAAATARPPLPPGRAAAPAAPSQATQARLQTQANLQDSLTEELAGMAASLKSSTLAVEGKLRERGQLLGVAETALDHSLHHTRKSAAEATRIHSKGRLNFCLTCLVMLVVGLAFAGMYAFIKVTSFAGYRAPRGAPPAPAPAPALGGAGGEL